MSAQLPPTIGGHRRGSRQQQPQEQQPRSPQKKETRSDRPKGDVDEGAPRGSLLMLKASSVPSLPQVSPKGTPTGASASLKPAPAPAPANAKSSYVIQFGNNSGLKRGLFRKRRGLAPGVGDSGNPCGKLSYDGKRLEVAKPPSGASDVCLLWTAWRSEDFLESMANRSSVYVALNTSRTLEIQQKAGSAGRIKAHNHFDGNAALCRKMELRQTIVDFYSSRRRDPFGIIPVTCVVNSASDPEFERWKQLYAQEKAERGQQVWLVKPGRNSNQGRAIEVYDTVEDVQRYVESKDIPWVVQKYLENPYLLNGRKFDIRMFCVITQDPGGGSFHAHFFNDGYVRTTSAEYTTENLDRSVHITNDQVQCLDKDYGKFEEGNKMSLADLQAYMVKQSGAGVGESIIEQMKSIMIDTVHAAQDKLNPRQIDNCFELFGFDFMIDSACRVWLIEVNTDPSLEVHSRHQQSLIPAMVDGLFHLTIDRIFGLSADVTKVKGMRWEHIYPVADPGPSPDAVACDWVGHLASK